MTVLVGIVVKKDTSVVNVQNPRQKASMDMAKAGMVIRRNNSTIDTHWGFGQAKEGETQKTIDGIIHCWCSECKMWHTDHDTKSHVKGLRKNQDQQGTNVAETKEDENKGNNSGNLTVSFSSTIQAGTTATASALHHKIWLLQWCLAGRYFEPSHKHWWKEFVNCLFMLIVLGLLAWQVVGYLMTCSTGCNDYFMPVCIEPTKDMLRSSLIVCCMFSSWWKCKRLFEKSMVPPVHLPLLSCIHCQWHKQHRYPRHYHLHLRIMRCLPWLYPYYYGDKFQDIDPVEWWESVRYWHWCNAIYYEFYHGSKLDEFIETLDLTKIMQVLKQDFILTDVAEKNGRKQCQKLWQALIAVDMLIPEELRGRRTVYFNDKEVYPIVFDSGTSNSITPVIEDFIGPICPTMTSIHGLMNETKVEGIGHVRWNVKDVFSKVMTIETDAYLISNAEVRLFSPQVSLQEKKAGEYIMRWDTMTLRTPEGDELKIPYYHGNNLPMAFESPEQVNVTLAFNEVTPDGIFMSVADETNQNLTKAQRELLQWHWKLGHLRFQWLQGLMRPALCLKNGRWLNYRKSEQRWLLVKWCVILYSYK